MSPAVYIPPSSFWSYGTADPTGGSNGDFYFKTDGTNVLSVWKKVAGTWTNAAAFGTGSGGSGAGSTAAITVTGTQDGANKVFTLSSAITAGVGLVFINGQLLIPGASNDYVISGTTLTFQAACPAPLSTDVVQVFGYTDTANAVTGTAEVAVTGTKDGTNKIFTISNAINGVGLVFLNGQLLTSGSSSDYTIAGTTLTFTANRNAPLSTDVIRVMGYVSAAAINVPAGGAAGQALVKNSNADGDLVWASGGQSLISTTVVGTASNTINLGTLPTQYTHLRAVLIGRSNVSAQAYDFLLAVFNNDTTVANYVATSNANGSSSTETTHAGGFTGLINGATSPANARSHLDLFIPHYKDTLWSKTWQSKAWNLRASTTAFGFDVLGNWQSTSAITSLKLVLEGGQFLVGTTVWLYGIV